MNDEPTPLAGPYTAFIYGDPTANSPRIGYVGPYFTAGFGGFAVSASVGGGGAWTFVS